MESCDCCVMSTWMSCDIHVTFDSLVICIVIYSTVANKRPLLVIFYVQNIVVTVECSEEGCKEFTVHCTVHCTYIQAWGVYIRMYIVTIRI